MIRTIPQKFRSKSDCEEITNGLKLYVNKYYKEECLTRRKAMTNHILNFTGTKSGHRGHICRGAMHSGA